MINHLNNKYVLETQAETCLADGKGLEPGDNYNPTGH